MSSSCAPAPADASCASRAAAAATSMMSCSLASDSMTTRNESSSPCSSASRIAPFVRSSRRAFTSCGVGTVAIAIFCFITHSMFRSKRCSRGSASVIATPSRPARPVRPVRWTYASGDEGTSKFTTCEMCSMSIPRAATSVATSRSTVAPRAFFITRSRSVCDIPPCNASTR